MNVNSLLNEAAEGRRLSRDEAFRIAGADHKSLLAAAAAKRTAFHGDIISYSRKVFIPLIKLCRDSCHYCTFARPSQREASAFMSLEEVLAVARAGKDAGCGEALFTLGDKPELRYRNVREELDCLGHPTTLSYLAEVAERVFRETGLLPHVNPGVMTPDDLVALRRVSVSQGLMLESGAERLAQRGGPHHGSPDKLPELRLATLRHAGQKRVPFTTGILVGIGETSDERLEALLALREIQDAYGHIQEIIVQNFQPKAGTPMSGHPAASSIEHQRTIAIARLLFAPEMNIQAPPNLSRGRLNGLIEAGINDWGGVSPVTPDHVNPEAPWPHLAVLENETRDAGKELVQRLAIYPAFARDPLNWIDGGLRKAVLDSIDSDGWPRVDQWHIGAGGAVPQLDAARLSSFRVISASGELESSIGRARGGIRLSEEEIVRLFRARGKDFAAVCRAADSLRREVNGDVVSYIVNRNINYTNICLFACAFCAFSKGKTSDNLRGSPYLLSPSEVAERALEAWERGATEVCMQGGIHPSYTGRVYLDMCEAVKARVPDLHIHAFSPLEIVHGASTLDIPVADFLRELQAVGLGTLPGTAAEILDDEVRDVLCPDKIRTEEWLEVMRTAHELGLRSTATIMFGHVDRYEHWARHLLRIRDLQEDTGGFTEFVPLPFVHMEAPIYLKGKARRGPTFRETVLMHAVARLVLHPHITNIQASWVKLGHDGVKLCLSAGVNDLGGTLMNESISRAAGAGHGQETTPEIMEAIIKSAGRMSRQRTTCYGDQPKSRYGSSGLVMSPQILVP